MDPNECLKRIREINIKIVKIHDTGISVDMWDQEGVDSAIADLAIELAELVTALDEWLVKRGFLPSAWTFAAEATVLANPPQPTMTRRALKHLPNGWNNIRVLPAQPAVGIIEHIKMELCPRCNGTGKYTAGTIHEYVVPCEKCDGTGKRTMSGLLQEELAEAEMNIVRCKNCQVVLSPEPQLEEWGFCSSTCEREHTEVGG